MNKVMMLAAIVGGSLLVACSSTSGSISPREQLAAHFSARGEMHAALDDLVGEFEVVSNYKPRANANPRVTMGTASGSWDDQRLVLSSVIHTQILETPVDLTSSMTWDDIRGCYVGTWTDGKDDAVLDLCDGHVEDDGSIVSIREEDGTRVREVLRIVSHDRHVREIYRIGPDGQEYLSWSLEMERISD